MSGRTWEVAARGRTDVGEGPAWDAREGVLWFIDVTPGALYRLDPASGDVDVRLVGLPIGAAIPSREGASSLRSRMACTPTRGATPPPHCSFRSRPTTRAFA